MTWVSHAVSTWQYSWLGPSDGDALNPESALPKLVRPIVRTTSQSSVVVRPVLTPPWSITLFGRRALALKSKPFQCSICLPKLSESWIR